MSGSVRLDRAAIAQLLQSSAGPVAKDLLRRAIKVDRAAKQLCPVDTGRLRSSIGYAVERDSRGLLARIGSAVVYAPYVELGTRRQPAQPYLRPALKAADR